MRNIHYRKIGIFFTLLFGMITNVYATSPITVTDGYIKASIPGSDITAAYMTISNTGDKAITLQEVSSTISDRIEIHEHSMADGMMRMREVGEITIKAHSKVILQPSGLHLMIFSLKHPMKEKSVIPLTLKFSNKTNINIQLPVYRFK
ncbi:copper chaperone PCu(A)C [Colwellia demingiae]|uniref:Copper chaperone PCu(A)C n=1 Tax=Colwellia demingiae TaxID=89401 RepID=A0A5C6QPC7_9GAMM|nr:copper chaperone PCu(A)C [Colwellia demingiae]TWX70834.1 copper chaperone PCu(A)C [Colwellia demingiae]